MTHTELIFLKFVNATYPEALLTRSALPSAACSDCVNDHITNMSQVAFGEMECHLFHRGLAH